MSAESAESGGEGRATARSPLCKLFHKPDVFVHLECDGCATITYVVSVVDGGFSAIMLGNTDEEGSFSLKLCAQCLRALADRTDAFAKKHAPDADDDLRVFRDLIEGVVRRAMEAGSPRGQSLHVEDRERFVAEIEEIARVYRLRASGSTVEERKASS